VYRYVGDAHEAEDIAQEVFVRLFLARKKYVSQAPFRPFLYKIAVNLCLNEVRRRRRRPVDVGVQRIPEAASTLGDPQSETAREELARHVRGALQQLPDAQRMAVVLSRYNELSYREIAEAMDCSVKAVEALLHRAKRSLAKQLGEYVGAGSGSP
jgi:RNA polymerase sigma-70 factor (ECF subfamily)